MIDLSKLYQSIVATSGGEGPIEEIPSEVLVAAYHAFGVLVNAHHLMMHHHKDISVVTVDGLIPSFVWECDGKCHTGGFVVTATFIPNTIPLRADKWVQRITSQDGWLIPDIIQCMVDPESEIVHEENSFRMRNKTFGFLEIR